MKLHSWNGRKEKEAKKGGKSRECEVYASKSGVRMKNGKDGCVCISESRGGM